MARRSTSGSKGGRSAGGQSANGGTTAPPSGPKHGANREHLISELELIAQYLEILGENDFKIRAYRKGAEAVASSDAPLADIASGKVKVAGVGDSLKGVIREYLETGAVQSREELSAKVPAAVLALTKVRGLGPKRALIIHQELGINTVGELEYACRENRLAQLKGFGKAVQDKIIENIHEMDLYSGKLRLDEAFEKARMLQARLKTELGEKAEVIPVGALGRRAEIIERIELFFTGTVENVARAILSLPWEGNGGLDERRQEFPADGSGPIELAGFSARIHGGPEVTLWVCEDRVDEGVVHWLCGEEQVRERLARDPASYAGWERTWLEKEWLEAGRRPAADAYRVARDGGVKGIFHCHTDFSDGTASLEQMVRAAETAGYQYIGISDHSQTASYAGGLKPERIREQRKLIEALQKKVSIRIFHGVESDILADGALDYDPEVLGSFDFIVGSIHSRFKMEEAAMTDRVVRALNNPFLTIWGHPTGRLLLARKPYGLRWEACLEAAAKNGVVIEINSNPQRLDLDWRMGAEIEKRKIRVAVNPDAHSAAGIGDTSYGEYTAEKAMIPRDLILNRMTVDEVEKYLWERKKKASR